MARRRGVWGSVAGITLALVAARPPAHAGPEISLYGDVDSVLSTTGTRRSTQDGFSAAKLELFTSTTAGRWLFLAETMFEAGTENSFELDVERVEVGYLYTDWLRVLVGRFHTAIGYYNDAFHHGAYFMVPVGRPKMVEFEDGGGLIPAHNVGIHVDGRFPLGQDHLHYDLELANGRAADPLEIQNNHDTNRPKAVNLRLRYEPSGVLDGLTLGGNVYFDSIPGAQAPTTTMDVAGGAGAAPLGAIHEWLFGVHAAYFEHDLHFITEALVVQHTELTSGARHRTYAAFAELGRSFEQVTPYVRYEWTRFPSEGDPYYGKASSDGYQAATVGVKHATTENIALKAQAQVLVSSAPGSDPLFTFTGQVAFAF